MAPSVRGLPPQAGGGESLALYEVSDEDAFLSLSPLCGQCSLSGASRHLPRIGGVCLTEGAFCVAANYIYQHTRKAHLIAGGPFELV